MDLDFLVQRVFSGYACMSLVLTFRSSGTIGNLSRANFAGDHELAHMRTTSGPTCGTRCWRMTNAVCAKQLCNHTLQKIFALLTQAALLEPPTNISLKPSALGEGALRLQVCVNAVKFAIIDNLIELDSVWKAVCTTKALCSFQ